jgi:hypothetical protein
LFFCRFLRGQRRLGSQLKPTASLSTPITPTIHDKPTNLQCGRSTTIMGNPQENVTTATHILYPVFAITTIRGKAFIGDYGNDRIT